MIPSHYRETSPPGPSSPPIHPDRYLASDFKRLTNRRLTAPSFTPDFEIAHEARAEAAECSNEPPSGVIVTSDKRAPRTFTPTTRHPAKANVNTAQGTSGPSSRCSQSNQSSRCSSTGGYLDTCVKEDNSGESPRSDDTAEYPNPFNICHIFCVQIYTFTQSIALPRGLYYHLITYFLPKCTIADHPPPSLCGQQGLHSPSSSLSTLPSLPRMSSSCIKRSHRRASMAPVLSMRARVNAVAAVAGRPNGNLLGG